MRESVVGYHGAYLATIQRPVRGDDIGDLFPQTLPGTENKHLLARNILTSEKLYYIF
jgi:hypothetical protein